MRTNSPWQKFYYLIILLLNGVVPYFEEFSIDEELSNLLNNLNIME
jgi:hypothetical protein